MLNAIGMVDIVALIRIQILIGMTRVLNVYVLDLDVWTSPFQFSYNQVSNKILTSQAKNIWIFN